MRIHTWWISSAVAVVCLLAWQHQVTTAQGADGPTVMAEGKELASGDTYIIPGHSETSSLALFSESVQVVTFYNKTGADMTIDGVELTHGDGVMDEEFTLLKNQIKREPLGFEGSETVADGKHWACKVRFFPVESGTRTGKLTVTYNGDKTHELNLQGRGRGEAKFFSGGETTMHKLFGNADTDEMLSSAMGGPDGSIYFTGQATQIADKFSTDLFWAKVNADGTLAWAKLWNGAYLDRSPDSGQNAETGGTCNSMFVDDNGDLYLCGATSPNRYNSNFAALVIKVSGETGETVWEKMWRPEWASSLIARHSAEAYALTVADGMVYVTGVNKGNAEVLLLGLRASDGEPRIQHSFDITPGTTDRGYSIVHHNGELTIGGLADSRAFLVRISGFGEEGDPGIAWSKSVDMGRGSGINCLAVDEEGNVYASCDRRGASTFFSVIKVGTDGSLAWGKTYTGTAGDRSNTHLVRYIDGVVYVGGRLGAKGFDTAYGDGLLLALNAEDGAEKWTAFYYTGTGPDESCEHRIKGVAVNDGVLTVVGQSYTGSRNGERYWGYWYNGVTGFEDYEPELSDLGVAEDALTLQKSSDAKDAAESRKIIDLAEKLEWIDASARTAGQTNDGDISCWQIKLK